MTLAFPALNAVPFFKTGREAVPQKTTQLKYHRWAGVSQAKVRQSLFMRNTCPYKKYTHEGPEKDVLWMKKRQGQTCPIDTTGYVSSYLGSHQQQAIDVTDQLPAPSFES